MACSQPFDSRFSCYCGMPCSHSDAFLVLAAVVGRHMPSDYLRKCLLKCLLTFLFSQYGLEWDNGIVLMTMFKVVFFFDYIQLPSPSIPRLGINSPH